MSVDRILTWLGFVLALPGFLLNFLTQRQTLGVITLILAGVVLLVALAWKWYASLPNFSLKSAEVDLEFPDGSPDRAKLTKKYRIRANKGDRESMLHRNIASDGEVSNICWNGQPVPSEQIREVLGEYEVTVRFDPPPRRWSVFPGKLSYELTDSFPAAKEGLIYAIDFPTKKAVLRIHLPADKPCRKAWAVRVEGSGTTQLDDPIIGDDGTLIEFHLKKPEFNTEYGVYWYW